MALSPAVRCNALNRNGRHARRERSNFALVVGFAWKYDRDAGVGAVVALMLPYVAWMFALWILLSSRSTCWVFPGECNRKRGAGCEMGAR